ncbi:unnamed protein product [Microthlaspi erraticum]|uniref:Uncharacterized protein n=1 Tax=Microthlaspi erraticum TaxID=1685480 RepID=A0A6D2HEN6_9BRAS|nr:unnamed protein product [Microthlaspi erraticum]CAA7031155.1 unnamed protein product [Microthlaspi erraticum]
MEEAERVTAEADRREAAEEKKKAEADRDSDRETSSDKWYRDGIPSDDSDADSERDDEGASTPNRARLKGIPEMIKMPEHAKSKAPRITDGRTWMTPEILLALVKRVGFSGRIEFRIPKEHERPYDAPPG